MDLFNLEELTEKEIDNSNVNTPKERFYNVFKNIKSLSDSQKEFILNWLEKYGFFEAPAAAQNHSNYPSGLVEHSLNVADFLVELTEKNQLKWKNKETPILIGLLHDLCKVCFYKLGAKNVKNEVTGKWESVPNYSITDDTALTALGNHGDRSATMALLLLMEKDPFESPAMVELISGIRFHMGFSQDGDTRAYSNAMAVNQTLPWVNLADTLAANKETQEQKAKEGQ